MNNPPLAKKITIKNKLGLHTRAATKLVNCASCYASNIQIVKQNKIINGKSIMGVMLLAASKGSKIELIISGEDQEEAMEALETLINNRFGEKE